MKNVFIVSVIITLSCIGCKQKEDIDNAYLLAEIEFLDQLLSSEVLIIPNKPELNESELKLLNGNRVLNIFDTLQSFEDIGISNDVINKLLGKDDRQNYNFDLKSQKAYFKRSSLYDLNIIKHDISKVTFDNSYYKISRVSFDRSYTQALIAIELVCFDCGGLGLYNFSMMKSGDWELKDLINVWIN